MFQQGISNSGKWNWELNGKKKKNSWTYSALYQHFSLVQCGIMPLFLCYLSDVSFSPLFPQKDNGGPLVCQEHERKVIIGVSIQRTKCASSQPALFVNVAFYSEWIYKVFKLYPNLERNWWCGVKVNSVHDLNTARERRGGLWASKFQDLSSMNQRGEKWGKSPDGKWPFWDFVPEFVILQRRHSLVIEDWINQTESILPLCKWRHPGGQP